MRNFAHYNIDGCKHITKIDNGPGGLINHLQSKHLPVYDSMMGIGLANQTPAVVGKKGEGLPCAYSIGEGAFGRHGNFSSI